MVQVTADLYYILDEHGNPVPEHDTMVWARWYEASRDKCILHQDFHEWQGHRIMISTVFLSIAHPILGSDKMALYETMVFTTEDILEKLMELSERDTRGIMGAFLGSAEIQQRYETKAEAINGHKAICDFVDVVIQKNML